MPKSRRRVGTTIKISNVMRKILLVLLAVGLLTGCNQSAKEKEADAYAYLEKAWSFVEAGECDSAQIAYSKYLQIGHDSLPNLEDAIDECRFNSKMLDLEKAAAEQKPGSFTRINITPEQLHQLFVEDDEKVNEKAGEQDDNKKGESRKAAEE